MDRILLIVGGSSDIGLAIIEDQIALYDKVIVHYNHLNSNLQKLWNDIQCNMFAGRFGE